MACVLFAIGSLALTRISPTLVFLPTWIGICSLVTGGLILPIFYIGYGGTRNVENSIVNNQKNWSLVAYAFMMGILCIIFINILLNLSPISNIENQIELLSEDKWKDIQDTLQCCGYKNNSGNLATSIKFCSNQTTNQSAVIPCENKLRQSIDNSLASFSITFCMLIAASLL